MDFCTFYTIQYVFVWIDVEIERFIIIVDIHSSSNAFLQPHGQVRLSFGLACHSKSNHYLPHSTRYYEAMSSQSGVDGIDISQKTSQSALRAPRSQPSEKKET